MKKSLTSLGLILRAAAQQGAPVLPKPDIEQKALKLWIKEGINPNRQRKGVSGELPRKR